MAADPAEKCTNCGARRDAHTPAANGGLDCPPRADGKVPVVTGHRHISYAVDEVHQVDIIEWRDKEPETALDVLRLAAGLDPEPRPAPAQRTPTPEGING